MAKLFLIPNRLFDQGDQEFLTQRGKEIVGGLRNFIVESAKPANRLLKHAGVATPFEGIAFYELNEHTKDEEVAAIIKPLLEGYDMGLISDAGYPAIADPGEKVVRLAHLHHIRVVPLVGASSVFLALAASGLNAESFCFHGYLPAKKQERIIEIRQLCKEIVKNDFTQIFIETPYRNQAMFEDLIAHCHEELCLCVAADISSDDEMILTKSIKEWKSEKADLNKRQVVFLLGS